jgi:DNA topoisomerase-1
MKDAVGQSVTIRIGGVAEDGRDVVFTASGRVITFHGFLKAYVEGTEGGKRTDDQETPLPDLAQGDPVSAASLTANGHETKPPARYTEATLIKELEEREIGRPSTYASIIGTILARGYVYKKGTALVPAWIAFSVVRLLEEHFPRQISYEFTAGMEDVLDEIAAGRASRVTELEEFYFGSDRVVGLHQLVNELGEIDAKELATFPVGGPDSGIVLRVGRYGPYLEGPGPGDDGEAGAAVRANVPDDLPRGRTGQRHRATGGAVRAVPGGPRAGLVGERGGRRRRRCGPGERARRPTTRRADPRPGAGAAGQPGG